MTARIESVADMAALPVGTVLTHIDPLNGPEVAIRTTLGWEVSGQRWATNASESWVGADVMVRKADLMRLAQRLDTLAGLSAGIPIPIHDACRTVDLTPPTADDDTEQVMA